MYAWRGEVDILKKFKFRLQVVLEMRENELEQRRIEAAKILAMLKEQEAKLQNILDSQKRNIDEMDSLYSLEALDIQQLESHKSYGIKLTIDEQNQQRIINNTKVIFERKQIEVREAHKKFKVLKKLKEKQEQEYYKEFWHAEGKELDDMTSARFNLV